MNMIIEQVNSMGKAFVEFAGPMLVQSSVLIAILLLVDFVLRRRVRAVFRYWIWMLVLLKLVLPPTLSSPLSLGRWFGDHIASWSAVRQAAEVEPPRAAPLGIAPTVGLTRVELEHPRPAVLPALPESEPVTVDGEHVAGQSTTAPAVPATPVTWQGVTSLIWLAVAVGMGLLLLQRAMFVRGLVAQGREANDSIKDKLEDCCRRIGLGRKIGLKISANAASPAVCGLFGPVILVPQNLAPKLGAEHLRTVLLHELAHIKRGDLWVNLMQTILQIVYFYNPLLWLANAIIRRIREQAVDEMVLVAMGEKAHQYPQTLVRVAKLAFKQPALSLRLIGVVESKSALASRIRHIVNRPIPRSAKLGILGLLSIIVAGILLLPMAKAEKQLDLVGGAGAGSLDHFVGKYAMAERPDRVVVEITKKGDILMCKGVKGPAFEMESMEGGLRYAQGTWFCLRYDASNHHYYLDTLRPSEKAKAGVSVQLLKTGGGRPRDVTAFDHFVGRYVRAGDADRRVIEVTTKGDTFVFKDMRGHTFEMEEAEEGLRYTDGEWFGVRYDASDHAYYLDKLGRSKMATPGASVRLVKISVRKADATFAATLPDGVTVELLCLYYGQKREDLTFWRPDGSLISSSECERYRQRAIFPKWTNFEDFKFEYGLIVSFNPLDDLSTDVFVKQGQRMTYNYPKSEGIAVALVASDRNDRKEGFSKVGSIKVAVASGPWDTHKSSARISEPSVRYLDDRSMIMFSPPRKTDEWLLDVTVNSDSIDLDCFYELKEGSIHHARSSGTIGHPDWIGPEQRTPMSIKQYSLFHEPEQIKDYIIKYRKFEIIEFKNVSLKPNFKTDVQVEVEEAAAVSAESEVGPVPIVHGVQNKATLPNGVTVELVGLFRGKTKETLTWWHPDGNEITKGEFASYSRKIQDKWIRDTDFWKFEYGYALKVTPSEDVSVGTSATVGQTTHNSPATGGKCVAIVESDETMRERGLADIGEVIVSVAYGGWKDFGGQKSTGYEDIYPLENGSTILISDLLPSRTRPESMSSVVVTDNSPDDIEIRVVYELKDGRVCEAWKLSWIGARRKSRGSPLVQTTFDIPAKRQDIKHLWVEYRPCYKLRFKDVSLRPGVKTDVEVERKYPSDWILMHEGFYSFGEGETYSKRLSQIFSKVETYIGQVSAGYVNENWDDVSEGAIQVRDAFLGLKESLEVDEAGGWEAFAKMWEGEAIDVNEAKRIDLARVKRTLQILGSMGTEDEDEETYQNLCTSIVSIADASNEIQKTLRTKGPTMVSPHIEKLQADWSMLTGIDGIKELLRSGLQTKEKTDVEVEDKGSAKVLTGESQSASSAGIVAGRVLDEKGDALSDAQVALCTAEKGVVIREGKLEPTKTTGKSSEITKTGADGRFSFSMVPDDFHIIVAHEKGFAWIAGEEMVSSSEIQVKPWGRIEGTLRIGSEPGTDKRMGLLTYINKDAIDQGVRYDYEARTDEKGRFVFERVPPGWAEVGYMIRMGETSYSYTNRTRIEIKPGQSLRLAIGGTGRPVVGKFVWPEAYDQPIYFGEGLRALVTARPEIPYPEGMTELEKQDWYSTWRESEEGRAHWESHWHNKNCRHFVFMINSDGTFRIGDVPEGKYQLTVWIEERDAGLGRREKIARYYGTVEVPPIPGGRSDEPLDLGTLGLKMAEKEPAEQRDVQVEREEVWGEAVEGVQCQLRAHKIKWRVGEIPAFKVDVRNGGERHLQLPESPDHCLVEVDGRWFFISGYEPGKEVGFSTRVLDLLPGQQRTGIPLELSDKWETMLDSEVALGAYVRRAGIMTGPGLRSRLKLTPGRHTIHVSFILGATRRGAGLHPPAPVQVVSNPVEITIEGALPGSGLSIDEAIKEEAAFAAVCEAVEQNVPVRSRTVPGVSPTSQVFKVVEVLFGKAEAVDRVQLNYKYLYKEPECERAIRRHERVIWIGHTRNMSFHGSLYGLKALPDTGENRQAVKAAASQAATTAWGEAVEGVQCRLRVDKAVWESGEVPTFHADVRNNGEREIVLPISEHGWGLEFDGEWYESRARPTVGLRKLPPGEEYCGVKLTLGSWWLRTKNLRERIQLTPGKHTVRVSCYAKRDIGSRVRAISNPVEIEILPAYSDVEHKSDVQVEVAKETVRGKLGEVRAIEKILSGWFESCTSGNLEGIQKAWLPDKSDKAERDLRDMNELLGTNPSWQFSVLAAMWDEGEAIAVSGAFEHGDPKVAGPMILVWRLKKTEGGWLLSDIDLEELEGLQIENSRFMQDHPDAQVWFDNPDPGLKRLNLTDAPCETNFEDLPELFEERPSGSGSYHIREGVTTVYNGLDGTVYYIPAKRVFYVQRDNAGASTLHYYGPFKGDPREALGLGTDQPVEGIVGQQTNVKARSTNAERPVPAAAGPTEETQPAHPGRIRGVVVSAVTGEPIAGAYVGVGDFGDSGGSNYSRHRAQGFFAKTKTDEQGRFELDGLVFTDESPELDYHPLVVTHPDFVRHDEKIELLKDKPAPDVKVRLGPAAKIDVTIVDAQGNSLEGQWLIRLEALDGRRFIPPGGDPHLSSFASSIWAHWPDLRAKKGVSQGFTFTELDTGEYSIEALRLQLVDNPTPGNIWVPTITYHGSIPKLKIDSGQTREVRVKPAAHQTAVAIKVPEVPAGAPKDREIHGLLMVSRKCELLVWDTGKVYHLEDHRLGRLQKNALFYVPVRPGQMYTIDNLPAGSYSVFASIVVYPALCMKGVKVEVVPGSEVMVEVPPIQISGQATVGLWTLNRSVKLEDRQYSVRELCTILTTITESNPRLLVDPSIENEKLQFSGQDMAIWDVLETICLEKKWRLGEVPERTLVLEPEASSTAGKHRVYLPDLETRNADVLLDLATGEMLGAVWLRDNKIAQLGKGDLAYEYASNRSSLLCLRGATLQLRTKQGLTALKPDVKREYLEGYFLEDIPCQYQVTTAEGNKFELQVFSIDEGDRGGAYIEFRASE